MTLATATFHDQEAAMTAAARLVSQELVVVSRQVETIAEPPPQPFTTATLLEEATTRLGWEASKVMQVAQSLFEGVELHGAHTGLITYHRTDSTLVSPEAAHETRQAIARLYGEEALPVYSAAATVLLKAKNFQRLHSRLHRRTDQSGTGASQEAHESIRPTAAARHPDGLVDALDEHSLALYRLIWERFIASQMRPAVYRQVTVEWEPAP